MRTLHVIQPLPAHDTILRGARGNVHTATSSLAALRAIVASDRKSSEEHYVVCIGGEASQLLARSAGLGNLIRVAPALGSATRAASQLRRVLAGLGRVDMAIGWGEFASDIAFKLHQEAAWWKVSSRSGEIIRMSERGEATGDAIELPWHIATRPRAIDRAIARTQLGLPALQPCLGLFADNVAAADATELMLCVSVLHAAGLTLSAALPAQLATADHAATHVQLGTYTRETAFVAVAPRAWAHACDVCIIGDGPVFAAGLLLCTALAANCAVVVTRATQLALGIDLPELAAISPRATDYARIILPLMDDAAHRARSIEQYRTVISQLHVPTIAQSWRIITRTLV